MSAMVPEVRAQSRTARVATAAIHLPGIVATQALLPGEGVPNGIYALVCKQGCNVHFLYWLHWFGCIELNVWWLDEVFSRLFYYLQSIPMVWATVCEYHETDEFVSVCRHDVDDQVLSQGQHQNTRFVIKLSQV